MNEYTDGEAGFSFEITPKKASFIEIKWCGE
jgi:hypothetical protein